MNSALKYTGSKWRIADWIISFMPPHRVYVEPYFGSGAVFFRKKPVANELINDIDGEVVNFFRVCRAQPQALAEAIQLTPWSRAEYYAAYDPATDALERARRFAVRCWQSFGGSLRDINGWLCFTAPNDSHPIKWEGLPQNLQAAAARLLHTQIDNHPALEVIGRYNHPDVLLYLDPPYLPETCKAAAYGYDMQRADHEELLQAVKDNRSSVLLSGYDSELYNDVLTGWTKLTHKNTTRTYGKRIDCVWLNYPVAEQLRVC